MEVDRGRLREVVDELHPYPVTLAHPDLRAGHLTVIGPRTHLPARLDLPVDLFGGELVNLDALLEPRSQELVTLALGPGGERLHALFVHGVHRVRLLARRERR